MRAFPEVLACDVAGRLAENVGMLRKQWRLEVRACRHTCASMLGRPGRVRTPDVAGLGRDGGCCLCGAHLQGPTLVKAVLRQPQVLGEQEWA